MLLLRVQVIHFCQNTLQLKLFKTLFQLQFMYYLIKDYTLVLSGAHKHWYSICNDINSSYHLDLINYQS